jgi:RimJ/RimL family protein N-acetyltransferase
MIQTERLVLRRWREEDLEPFSRLNADPEVMAWYGGEPIARQETTARIARYEAHFDAHGFGIWAVERRADGRFLGFSGLRHLSDDAHPMSPCIEAAWRQARFAWGHGYATEAAAAALADGFERVGLETVWAWTAGPNLRSQAVMMRVGMTRQPTRDFETQALPDGHPLRPHVVFSINRRPD